MYKVRWRTQIFKKRWKGTESHMAMDVSQECITYKHNVVILNVYSLSMTLGICRRTYMTVLGS
jgi:hypothetical protein